MPEQEFELYLSLLGRFLRLKPSQLSEVSDELRDHLEARLEELAARGIPRDEAIRQALAEFGDATELAHHFTQIAKIRRRRVMMRFTLGTVASTAAAILLFTAFWPETPQLRMPERALAQQATGAGRQAVDQKPVVVQPVAGLGKPMNPQRAAVEAKLTQSLKPNSIVFVDTPLEDAVQSLRDILEIDILFDKQHLTEEGIATDSPVTLKVEHTELSVKSVLEVILEPLQLSWALRDGYLLITTKTFAAEQVEVGVYNIRDLLVTGQPFGQNGGFPAAAAQGPQDSGAIGFAQFGVQGHGRMMMPGGAASKAATDEGGKAKDAAGGGGMSGTPGGFIGGAGGGMAGAIFGGGGAGGRVSYVTDSIAELVALTVEPSSWEDGGGPGTVVQYRDRLVVRNTQAVHAKVKELLEMLREAAAHGDPAGQPAVLGAPPTNPAAEPKR
ncbi:MAG: hypothetical protein JSS02_26195 [Planctomycetes bacterium]|nr:hypothetical protein [Planctomycetota bacterium]